MGIAQISLIVFTFLTSSCFAFVSPYFNSLNHENHSGIEQFCKKSNFVECINEMVPAPVVEISCAPYICKNSIMKFTASAGFVNYKWGTPGNEIATTSTPECYLTISNTGNLINPAVNELQVFWDQDLETQGQLKIYSLTGQIILESYIPMKTHAIKLDLQSIPGGSYMVKISDGKKLMTVHKLVILK